MAKSRPYLIISNNQVLDNQNPFTILGIPIHSTYRGHSDEFVFLDNNGHARALNTSKISEIDYNMLINSGSYMYSMRDDDLAMVLLSVQYSQVYSPLLDKYHDESVPTILSMVKAHQQIMYMDYQDYIKTRKYRNSKNDFYVSDNAKSEDDTIVNPPIDTDNSGIQQPRKKYIKWTLELAKEFITVYNECGSDVTAESFNVERDYVTKTVAYLRKKYNLI